jgi:hypothetical protein
LTGGGVVALMLCCGAGTTALGWFGDGPRPATSTPAPAQSPSSNASPSDGLGPADGQAATPTHTRPAPTTAIPKTADPTNANSRPAAPKTDPSPAPARTTDEPSSAYYRSCAEARAAGAAPLHRGDPGYRSGLDRDDDGTACE